MRIGRRSTLRLRSQTDWCLPAWPTPGALGLLYPPQILRPGGIAACAGARQTAPAERECRMIPIASGRLLDLVVGEVHARPRRAFAASPDQRLSGALDVLGGQSRQRAEVMNGTDVTEHPHQERNSSGRRTSALVRVRPNLPLVGLRGRPLPFRALREALPTGPLGLEAASGYGTAGEVGQNP